MARFGKIIYTWWIYHVWLPEGIIQIAIRFSLTIFIYPCATGELCCGIFLPSRCVFPESKAHRGSLDTLASLCIIMHHYASLCIISFCHGRPKSVNMWIYGKSCYHGPSLGVRDQHILGSWSSQGSKPALPPDLERSLGSRLRQCLFFPGSHHWKQLAELGRTCGWNKARCASCANSERREGLEAIPGRAWCNDGREFVPVTVSEGPVPVGASAGGRDIVWAWECIGPKLYFFVGRLSHILMSCLREETTHHKSRFCRKWMAFLSSSQRANRQRTVKL